MNQMMIPMKMKIIMIHHFNDVPTRFQKYAMKKNITEIIKICAYRAYVCLQSIKVLLFSILYFSILKISVGTRRHMLAQVGT